MQFVRRMLTERRQRLIGTVMTYIEREVYPKLTDAERRELRKRILAAVDSYHDVCLDMLKASVEDGSVLNDEAARLLARVNSQVDRLVAGG